jgi:ABC-type antimicrobial peptide transport system permease subunit
MGSFLNDIHHNWRSLARTPAQTLVAVVTLALGIATITVIFSVVNAFVFRPLPVEDAHELVVLATMDDHAEYAHDLSYPDYLDCRGLEAVFSDVAVYPQTSANFSARGQADRIWMTMVSGGYFSMLGVDAVLGRTFLPEEVRRGGSRPVVVLSHSFWKGRFDEDPGIVGEAVKLYGKPFTVVGVLPESFHGTEPLVESDAYVPVSLLERVAVGEGALDNRDNHGFRTMARLRPGVSVERARAAVEVLADRLAQEYPVTNENVRFLVIPERLARPQAGVAGFFHQVTVIFSCSPPASMSPVSWSSAPSPARRSSPSAPRSARDSGVWYASC